MQISIASVKTPAVFCLLYLGMGLLAVSILNAPKIDKTNMRPSLGLEIEDVEGALAYVDGEPILRADIIALATSKNLELSEEDIDGGIDLVNELVDELIHQKLLKNEAIRRRLDRKSDIKTAMSLARDDVLKDRLLRLVVEEEVDEELLWELYNEDSKRLRLSEEVLARHILVPNRDHAEMLSVRLKAGVDFAELASRFSIDPATAAQGGNLDYFSRDDMDKKFSDVAFSLPVGAISEPFKTRYGWHILKIEDKRVLDSPSYEELRDKIVRYKTFEVIEELINQLREKATIKYVNEAQLEP